MNYHKHLTKIFTWAYFFAKTKISQNIFFFETRKMFFDTLSTEVSNLN